MASDGFHRARVGGRRVQLATRYRTWVTPGASMMRTRSSGGRAQCAEQRPAGVEQYWDLVDLELVQHSGPQCRPRPRRSVVPARCGRLGACHGRLDAVGGIADVGALDGVGARSWRATCNCGRQGDPCGNSSAVRRPRPARPHRRSCQACPPQRDRRAERAGTRRVRRVAEFAPLRPPDQSRCSCQARCSDAP